MRPPMLPRGRGQSRAPRELYPTAVLVGLISKETGHPQLDLGLLKTIGPTAAHSPPKSERVVYLLPQRGLLQLLQLCLLGRDTVLDCPIRVQLKDQHGSRLRVANPRIEVRTEVSRCEASVGLLPSGHVILRIIWSWRLVRMEESLTWFVLTRKNAIVSDATPVWVQTYA